MPDTAGGLTIDSVLIGGILANVAVDGWDKGINTNGPWRNLIYMVEGGNEDKFMDYLMGTTPAGVVIDGSTPIVFPKPHQYPGNKKLLCLEVSSKSGGVVKPSDVGFDPNGNEDPTESKLLSSDYAYVTAHYGIPRYDVYGEADNVAFGNSAVPWANDSIRGYTANYPVPAGVMQGKVTAEKNDKALDMAVAHQEWTRQRKMFGYLFTDLLDSLVGTVNMHPLFGKSIGTMLFQPYDAASGTYSDGTRTIDLTYSWLWRKYDWNMNISKAPPYNWELQWDGSHYRYPYADHAVLATDSLS